MISTIDPTDKLVARVKHLPPASQVLLPLLAALTGPDSDVKRAADLISLDPALTLRLLQMTNPPFGTGRAVIDAHAAVTRLGLEAVSRAVALARVETLLRPSKLTGMDLGRLWIHGVAVGFAAQFIARAAGLPSNLAFTAGILHDAGKLILAEAYQPDYARLCEAGLVTGTTLIDREETRFATNHAEIGGRLLEKWNLAPELVAAVRYHHSPEDAAQHARLAACIHLADSLAHRLGGEYEGIADAELRRSLDLLDLNPSDVACHMDDLQEQVSFVQALCGSRS